MALDPKPIDDKPIEGKEGKVKACKLLSWSRRESDGALLVRCAIGMPPFPDNQTHEFEFESKAAIKDGIEGTEQKMEDLDLCHMVLQPALKADPALGDNAINARVGRTFTIDLTGAAQPFTQS